MVHRPSRRENCKQATTPRAKGEEEQEQTQKLLESLSPGKGLFEGACLIRSGHPGSSFLLTSSQLIGDFPLQNPFIVTPKLVFD